MSGEGSGAAQIVIKQLTSGGILIAPLGKECPAESISQYLTKIIRTESGLTRRALMPARFVPMLPGLPNVRTPK
jgi:protein-L-isoaspartate(D-aspartate) O-methyltransferase